MVSASRAAVRIPLLFACGRHMVNGDNIGGASSAGPLSRRRYRCGSVEEDVPCHGYTNGRGLACRCCRTPDNRQLIFRVTNNCPTTISWETFPKHSGGNTYHPSAKMDRISRESCSNSTPKQDLPLDRLYTIASLRHYHGPHHQLSFPSPWLNSLLVPWRQT